MSLPLRCFGVWLCLALLFVSHDVYARCEKRHNEGFHVSAGVFLSIADKHRLEQIEQALNQHTMFEARILQTDSNGKQVTGHVWIKRPGQLRLVYDPPSPWLLVANDGKVVFRDSQLDQTTFIPIHQTPLGLLLQSCIRLTDSITITGFHYRRGIMEVTLVRTDRPTEGSLTLIFSEKPVVLRAWQVIDAQGRETQVLLENVHDVPTMAASLFTLPTEPTDPADPADPAESASAKENTSRGEGTKSP
ncbi:MAG: outer membrane lipoprotein carrier protein LolA [Acetobacter sp.]|nr:outer membrane lipoprotein carrier protein LolA [Acetobacter sp.]